MEKKGERAQKSVNDDDTEELEIVSNNVLNDTFKNNENRLGEKYKIRRSRLVGPHNTKLTPTKRGGKRLSLLQKVQLSERRKMRSPLIIIKIRQMCKTVEGQLDCSIFSINSDQTPLK